MRARSIAAIAPLAYDVVITGADRDDIGALVYLDLEGAREFVAAPELDLAARLAAAKTATSERIARATIVAEEALASTGEHTAKGTIAHGAALVLRARTIRALHDDTSPNSERILLDR